MAKTEARRILVLGASRGIGRKVVERALEEGYRVRAFARGAESLGIADTHLEPFAGDALDEDDVTRALEGVAAVVQTLGVAPSLRRTLQPVTLFSEATRVLLPAMQAQGVRRLVAVTGFGAGESARAMSGVQRLPFRLALGRAYDDKSLQERLIRESDRDWTILRPVILTDGPRTGRYRVLNRPSEWKNGLISRADVADYAVKALSDPRTIGESPVLLQAPLPF